MTLGPFDYALWIAGFCLEVYVVVFAIFHRGFLRYIFLNLYLLALALDTAGEYFIIHKFGLSSIEYCYYYYYTESLLTISMFFVILQFYQQVFHQMQASKYIRGAAGFLLVGTSWFSYMVVHQNQGHLTSRFVVELGQNLHFVGVVLTYLLWGAILKLRETRARLVQLVLALGIYFSGSAATYALRNLFPSLELPVLKIVPPLVGLSLLVAWAYTFTKIPEDARLMTSRLLARAR